MTGDDDHRAAIVAVAVPIIGPSIYIYGMWVEDFLSDAYGCAPSSDDIDLSGIVSPPSDTAGAFPIIIVVYGHFKVL